MKCAMRFLAVFVCYAIGLIAMIALSPAIIIGSAIVGRKSIKTSVQDMIDGLAHVL